MTETQTPMAASKETSATTGANGIVMLLVAFCVVLLFIISVASIVIGLSQGRFAGWAVLSLPLLILTFLFIAFGFFMLQPNQAVAVTLFGSYKGTERRTGLRWLMPFYARNKISLRINNETSEKLKVNDKRGNPVEIAANVVWRVSDTAQALFDVENYATFVHVQIESGLRTIASRYPYDDLDTHEVTLREHAEQVSHELREELQKHVSQAGVTIDECRLTHLAYAPEIAGAMLRRQQAEAVIAARSKLVEGAVSMVEMALDQLSRRDVVHLDDERRAQMVSNLMVVLCSERDTQPVVNAGTLYN
jgi:regulator of protease activity HflC (stomatin/prohibitin superfamily)